VSFDSMIGSSVFQFLMTVCILSLLNCGGLLAKCR
jgi:hypothetical protein